MSHVKTPKGGLDRSCLKSLTKDVPSNSNTVSDVTAGHNVRPKFHPPNPILFLYLFFSTSPFFLIFSISGNILIFQPDPAYHHMNLPAHQTVTRPHSGGREDCWSEDATKILIDAWGDRYLCLNRGNLRQKDWKEVADAVNSRYQDGAKPFRTDVQCKNRIDTLKKKYKLEKAKPPPSTWPFYHHLEFLIGSNAVTQSNKKHITSTVTLTAKPTNSSSRSGPKQPLAYPMSSMSEDEDEEEGKVGHDGRGVGFDGKVVVRKHRMEAVGLSDGAACRELARAILKFGEIYERIESSKQQQMLELEKQRMEFTKDLEFQRLNMFMDAQVEFEKNKRPKHTSSTSGKKL